MNEGKFPLGTVGALAIGGGGIAGALYLGYKYFVEPGDIVLAQYRYILTDIYEETKKFLEDNAKLETPIYGLTAGQEQIIAAKENALERIRPDVETILNQRAIDVNGWFYAVVTGIVLVLVVPRVIDVILEKLKNWKNNTDSTNIQSSHGHSYILMEVLTNEMAELGNLNIASGFLSTMQSHYAVYTEPTLVAGISYYNALLPTLVPGSLMYIVTNNLLTYYMTEVSTTAGIMGALWSFWIPPII